MTITRTNDATVDCDQGVCPQHAPQGDYAWIGTVSLSAPNNNNAWSTTVRRNGTDGGEVVWTGNLEDGDSHDFTGGMPNPIAPGGVFTFSVTCNELLGSGTCSDSQMASIPECDCEHLNCPVPDPNNPGGQIELVCEGNQVLDPVNCVCYDPPMCDPGQHWDATCQCCCEDMGTEMNWYCDGTTLVQQIADGDCTTHNVETPDSLTCGYEPP